MLHHFKRSKIVWAMLCCCCCCSFFSLGERNKRMKKKNLVNSAEITKQSMSRKWMHITRRTREKNNNNNGPSYVRTRTHGTQSFMSNWKQSHTKYECARHILCHLWILLFCFLAALSFDFAAKEGDGQKCIVFQFFASLKQNFSFTTNILPFMHTSKFFWRENKKNRHIHIQMCAELFKITSDNRVTKETIEWERERKKHTKKVKRFWPASLQIRVKFKSTNWKKIKINSTNNITQWILNEWPRGR